MHPDILLMRMMLLGVCHDFKVITSLTADKFGDWQEKNHAPEEAFIATLKTIDGISTSK